MKGIMILGFNKSPGAYIDTKHPSNIDERLNVKTSDLMNIYALHRMRRMEPNYLQMKIKNVSVASFYTGFSFKHYVGKPNYTITVFLSDNDVLPKDFEGMIRRMANNLLPTRDEDLFEDRFVEAYEELKTFGLEPYWEEYLEGEGSVIATIHADESVDQQKAREKDEALEEASQHEELNFDNQFELFEKDELKEEVKELREQISEKNEKIRILTKRITEQVSVDSDNSEEVILLKGQLDEQDKKLDDWSLKLADIAEKNAILMETVRKLTEMAMDQSDEMERQGRKIIEQNKILQGKDAKIGELSSKVVDAKVAGAESSAGDAEELEEYKQEIDKLIDENRALKKQLEDAGEAAGDSAATDELKEKLDKIADEKRDLIQEVKDLIAKQDKIEKEMNQVNYENDNLKEKIEELEEKVKDSEDSDSAVSDELAEQIIELKKDIKVIRRERDHYKKIIKENDLL